MAKQIVTEMATNLSLDTKSATAALKELTSVVKNSSAEAKVLENQYKSSGEEIGASKAKYEGLQHTLDAQKDKIDALKAGLENVNTSTAKGRDLQTYLNNELAKAERQYASYNGQIEKAKRAYKLQESGITSLNKEIQQNIKETNAQVERLEAEGKTTEANKAKKDGLSRTLEKQSQLYETQTKELDRMTKSGEASADSISQQKVALDRTATAIAKGKSSLAELDGEQSKFGKNKGAEEAGTKMEGFKGKIGKSKEALVAMGATATAVLGTVAKAVSEAANAQSEVNALQAKTTLSYKESKQGIAAINKLYAGGLADSYEEVEEAYTKVAQLNPNATVADLAEKTKLVSSYAKMSGTDLEMVATGADKASKNWNVSYQEYFDGLVTLQKRGDDVGGDISDNLNEYSQVLAQMGFTAKDTFTLIDNGVKAGAQNGDKVLDYIKEFQNSITGGQLEENITNLSKKSQEMFEGYKNHKVSMKDLFNQITSDLGTMTDKQKAATIAANVWSGLGEDNSLKVIGSLGKTNKALDDTKGTADKTAKQLKEQNPFELMKRSAEASVKSISLNTSETKEFKKNLKPLQKSLTDLIKSIVDNLPVITKTLTPLLEFTSKHLNIIVGALATMAGLWGTKKILDFGSALSGVAKKGAGLIFKPKVDGSDAKRELGIIGKAGKKVGKFFVWSAKLGKKAFDKSWEAIKVTGSTAKKWGKSAFSWSANLGKKAFTKSMSALKTATVTSGRVIKKGLKFTASIATKGAKLAMAGLVKTAKVTGSGIKLAFNFLKANPLILLITGITAAVVALTTLYQHNKKFRNFVNGLVKSAQNFFKGIAKWFGQVYKKTLSIFKSILKFMQKDWKEILLLIVSPFAGAFALVYKHNAKFRKAINNLVKTVINYFKTMGKNISRIFNNIKDFIGDTLATIGKNWRKGWRSISNFFSGIWNGMKKFGHDAIWSVKNTFDNVLGKISKAFSNTWTGIKTGFSDMWSGMKQLAGDGINAVIKIPNSGISGINSLIHDFGGPKNAIGKIPKVKFANGTGAIDKLTHAVLNDGNDSPATGNKEMLIHPNGASEVVQGRNTERLLLPGTEVLNARETAMLMGLQGIQHFANGTGFWSKLIHGAGGFIGNVAGKAWNGLKNGVKKFTKMFEYITGAVKDPAGTLNKVMGLKNSGISNFADGIATGAFKKIKGTAKDWWSTLWNMANDASESGADGGMKGNDYKYKHREPDSYPPDEWGYYIRECVSFVANRLANLGVSASKFSHLGNGRDWVNAPVPHMSKPKVGSVAVYGPGSEFGNHVAMVTGVQGNKISGEEYNWNSDHNYHNYHGRNASGATTFLDFGLGGSSKTPEIKASGALQKLIKKQTGGMMGWIQKFIAPLNDSSTGKDGDVHSWADDVKKALRKLNLSTSGSMVQRVLRQIGTESGGNPNAKQPGADPDSDGSGPALGLMQTKRDTFNANALAGHKNIFNGYDNILAGLNYAQKRYGKDLSFLGNGHGYANGGLITRHQLAEIGENNQPEMIIPLSSMKSSRGFELIGQTAVAMAARDGQQNTTVTTDNSKLENKLDNMITLLSQLVQGQGNQIVQAIVDRNELYRKQASDVNLRDYQSLI